MRCHVVQNLSCCSTIQFWSKKRARRSEVRGWLPKIQKCTFLDECELLQFDYLKRHIVSLFYVQKTVLFLLFVHTKSLSERSLQHFHGAQPSSFATLNDHENRWKEIRKMHDLERYNFESKNTMTSKEVGKNLRTIIPLYPGQRGITKWAPKGNKWVSCCVRISNGIQMKMSGP